MKAFLYDTAHEAGMTLVEVLVAVSILSIAVVTIVSGLASTALSSDVHRKQATGDTIARSYAETLVQAVRGDDLAKVIHYTPCAASYSVPWYTVPSGYGVTTSIQYAQSGGSFAATCPAAGDLGLQKITVRAASADARDTEAFDVIVRQP